MLEKEPPISLQDLMGAKSAGQVAQLITRAAGVGVWSCDLRRGIFEGDQTAARMLGFLNGRRSAVQGEILRLIHRADRRRVGQWWEQASRSRDGAEIQFRARPAPDRVAHLCARTQAVHGEDGSPVFVVGVLWDATESQRREREHRAVVAISEALRELRTEDDVVRRAFDEIRELLETPNALVATREESGEERVRVVQACGKWRCLLEKDSTYEEGILGAVLKTREPYVSSEAANDPRCLRPEVLKGMRGFLAVPLISGNDLLGVLALGRCDPFDENDFEIVKALAEILATALGRLRHEKSLMRRMQELSILHEIDLAITNTLDFEFVIAEVLTQVLAHLGVDAAAVHLVNRATNTVECVAARGFRSLHIWHARPPVGKGLLGSVAQARSPVLRKGAKEIRERCLRQRMLDEEQFVAYAGFPLVARGEVVGVLELFHRSPLHFSPEWVKFAELVAGQVAVAVTNAELFTDLQRTHAELLSAYDATIEGWARAQELRDVDTERHCVRVAERLVELAEHLGYTGKRIIEMRRGALLHDIGKIGIPDAILRKPGPLTEEEWKIMREHPRLALEMLRPIKFLEPSLDIPAYHHERWDGRGYPFGLRGEEIPHAARFFAVVDVFDALTSERPYRTSWPEQEVLEYISAQAGSHFDPDVVRAFLDLMTQKKRGL